MTGSLFALVLLVVVGSSGYLIVDDLLTEDCLNPDTNACASACQDGGKHCLKKLYDVEAWCPMGYTDLYDGRLEANFSIKMFNKRDSNNTFLVAVYNGIDDSITGIVEDCCGLKEGEWCTLPPSSNGESFAIFHLNWDKTCYRDIQEYPSPYSWCDVKKENRPCIELNNGDLVIDSRWVDESLGEYKQKYRTDYCFFEVPEDFVRNGTKREDGFLQIEGLKFDSWEPTPRVSGVNETCRIHKSDQVDLETYWEKYNKTLGYTICFFIRVGTWGKKILCYEPSTVKESDALVDDSQIKMTVLGSVGISVVTIGALFALWFCRRRLPSFRQTEEQISKAKKNLESGQELREDGQKLDEKRNKKYETPDEIIFENEILEEQAGNDEVTPALMKKSKTL